MLRPWCVFPSLAGFTTLRIVVASSAREALPLSTREYTVKSALQGDECDISMLTANPPHTIMFTSTSHMAVSINVCPHCLMVTWCNASHLHAGLKCGCGSKEADCRYVIPVRESLSNCVGSIFFLTGQHK